MRTAPMQTAFALAVLVGASAVVGPETQRFNAQDGPPADAPAQIAAEDRPRPRDERALFELFAASPGFEARYEEEKHLGLLAVPIKSRGAMYFLPPGYLARVIDEPEPSRVLITPTEMRTIARGKEKRVDLARSADLRAFVTSLVQVFAGKREGLAQLWSIGYAPITDDPRGWTLTLVPRADAEGRAALTRMVSSLKLTGAGESVRSIEVLEPNGDRTVTRIGSSDARRVFTDAERAEWFDLPALAGRADGEKPR